MTNRYRLLKEHRFDGDLRPVGAEVSLREQLGSWLVEQGIIEQIVELPAEVQPLVPMAEPVPLSPIGWPVIETEISAEPEPKLLPWGCCNK